MMNKMMTQIMTYTPTLKVEEDVKTAMQVILKFKWSKERRKLLKSRNNWIIKIFWEISIEISLKYMRKQRLKRSILHLMLCLGFK